MNISMGRQNEGGMNKMLKIMIGISIALIGIFYMLSKIELTEIESLLDWNDEETYD